MDKDIFDEAADLRDEQAQAEHDEAVSAFVRMMRKLDEAEGLGLA